MNFRYKLMQFMSGRYGVDRFFYIIFAVAAAFSFINCFLRLWPLQLAVYALILYGFFRIFSRNIAARAAENRVVTGWTARLSSYMATARRRRADSSHIYKKCPGCRAVLRLPRRKGRHTTICPKCGKQFKVRVFRELS